MKRFVQLMLACAIMLAMVSWAAAQKVPEPVTRMGDWVEIGNEAFMNVIGTIDARYHTSHNLDFESDIQDRAASRNPADTNLQDQESDLLRAEVRWGADFRYKKVLRTRILFEFQQVFDGNLIDDRENTANPGPAFDNFGRAKSNEGDPTNLERFWIDYKFAGTPLRIRVGSDLWHTDQAYLLGDDDPRFAVFLDLDQWDLYAAAVIQYESARIGLQNDNDGVYYNFGVGYNMKPHRFQLDITYFRDRFTSTCAPGTGTATVNCDRLPQNTDTVLIRPSWTGTIGPLSALVQFNIVAGTVDGTGGQSYDVLAYSFVGVAEVNLGMVAPFAGVIYGSGDDDPNDDKLEGYNTTPWNDITLFTSSRLFNILNPSIAGGARDTACPARVGGLGGQQCGHTVGNPFNDRIGNNLHAGLVDSAYSNPGTLMIPAGIKFFPAKGHQIAAFYIYRGFTETGMIEANHGGVSIAKTQYHDLGLRWAWTLNRHFDFRLVGQIAIPGSGYKDLARTVFACGDTGTEQCKGKDPALWAEARFRARF